MADTEELDDEVKAFIVQALACFDSPKVVADSVKAEFDIVVSRQRVHRYNPTRKGGSDLSEKWVEIFNTTRKAFLDSTAEVGIANKSVRLRKLQNAVDAAESRGNYPLVIAACEAAAKEMGGAFTNRREHTGKDGGAIQHETKKFTDRDRAKAVASLVARSKAAGQQPAAPATKPSADGNKPA